VNTTVVACCQLTPVFGDPAANRELTADALNKATSPANDVHADRRPELYRRIAEQTTLQPTTTQPTTTQQTTLQQPTTQTPLPS
jgi:hypothetical protein